MADQFVETTRTSWWSRLKNSFFGVIIGLFLLLGSTLLLFTNEGRTVKRTRALKEGKGAVVAIQSDVVTILNEGKLVHLIGDTKSQETLQDAEFGIEVDGIKLRRKAEMYQWMEDKQTTSEVKTGGAEEKKTTYSYKKGWSGRVVSSEDFKIQEGHKNPSSIPYKDQFYAAQNVKIGAFTLSPSLAAMMNQFQPVKPSIKGQLANSNFRVYDNYLFTGAGTMSEPQVGDVRIQFSYVPDARVSIVAKQIRDTFEPYFAKSGSKIELLQYGTVSADNMFTKAQSDNKALGWILRIGGFLLMFAGFSLILKPLSVTGSVIPLVGKILQFGTRAVSGLLAFTISLIIIAIAWIYYRPLFAIILILAAVGIFILIRRYMKTRVSA
jgi:hypothetical protein